jgi:hypothetical protein
MSVETDNPRIADMRTINSGRKITTKKMLTCPYFSVKRTFSVSQLVRITVVTVGDFGGSQVDKAEWRAESQLLKSIHSQLTYKTNYLYV